MLIILVLKTLCKLISPKGCEGITVESIQGGFRSGFAAGPRYSHASPGGKHPITS